jgi:protein-S-isoprenylcysteine O-methyltransferase Ste14
MAAAAPPSLGTQVGDFKRRASHRGYNPPASMTTSASTPRLRLTLLWYLGLLATVAVSRPAMLSAPATVVIDMLALLLVGVAVLGRIWCSVYIAGRKDEHLVIDGPYSTCRHPLYTLSLAGGAGLGLATHSMLLTGATLLVLGVLFARAAVAEEAFLAQRHGEAFHAYARTTRRFWPRFARQAMPERLLIQPRVLWKAFVDAGAFVLLYALVVAARQAQALQGLPTLFDLR